MHSGDPAYSPAPFDVELTPVSILKPAPRNARTHSRRQVRQIAESIREFGWTNPVLIDEADRLIAGHGRLAAAKLLGLGEVPAIRLTGLSEPQKRALAIADNKLADNAGWDPEILAQELRYLSEVDFDFDVELTGFEAAEIDILIDGSEKRQDDDEADAAVEPPVPAEVSVEPGDLWVLGRHRLVCGDATDRRDVARLMDGQMARMVFTDPPYNVPINGHVCGSGRIKHREFAMASGEMTEAQFTAFLEAALGNLARHSLDGAIHYICMDWRHVYPLLRAGRRAYTELKNLCVWVKSNGGMGSLYRSRHELVAVFKTGKAPHVNNVELGRHGRYRTNVWEYAGVNALGGSRTEDLRMHPTIKPVAMVADAILDCSRRGAIVLDTFAGSGTTIVAAERTGRAAYALELDPDYAETAIRRWEQYTDETAVQAETGLGLVDLCRRRSRPPNERKPRIRIPSGSSRIQDPADG